MLTPAGPGEPLRVLERGQLSTQPASECLPRIFLRRLFHPSQSAGSGPLSQSPRVEVPAPGSFQSGGCNYDVLKQTNTHPGGRSAYLFD